MIIKYYLVMDWTIDDYLSLQTSGTIEPHDKRSRFRQKLGLNLSPMKYKYIEERQ